MRLTFSRWYFYNFGKNIPLLRGLQPWLRAFLFFLVCGSLAWLNLYLFNTWVAFQQTSRRPMVLIFSICALLIASLRELLLLPYLSFKSFEQASSGSGRAIGLLVRLTSWKIIMPLILLVILLSGIRQWP